MCLNDNGRWYGDVYHNAIVAASEDEELYKLWNERLKSILHDFGGFGWGMEEYIYDFLLMLVEKSYH